MIEVAKQGNTKKTPYSPTLDKMFGSKERAGRTVQWAGADPTDVYRLVVAVNAAGGSVLLGATKDRGAWTITIWHPQFGDKPRTEVCSTEDMFPGWVADMANIWEAVAEELDSSQNA